MFTKELSTKILRLIDEREMTIESLAEAAGLTREFVSNIVNCKQVPTLTSFEKICSAFELEPNDLLISEKSKSADRMKPIRVSKVLCHKQLNNVYAYSPICPVCNSLLKSNWQSYCDSCGQRLSWERFFDSEVILENPKYK